MCRCDCAGWACLCSIASFLHLGRRGRSLAFERICNGMPPALLQSFTDRAGIVGVFFLLNILQIRVSVVLTNDSVTACINAAPDRLRDVAAIVVPDNVDSAGGAGSVGSTDRAGHGWRRCDTLVDISLPASCGQAAKCYRVAPSGTSPTAVRSSLRLMAVRSTQREMFRRWRRWLSESRSES
jgi:hypothetical protein